METRQAEVLCTQTQDPTALGHLVTPDLHQRVNLSGPSMGYTTSSTSSDESKSVFGNGANASTTRGTINTRSEGTDSGYTNKFLCFCSTDKNYFLTLRLPVRLQMVV